MEPRWRIRLRRFEDRRGPTTMPAPGKGVDIIRKPWTTEQEALPDVAAELSDQRELFQGLDALGRDTDAEVTSEIDRACRKLPALTVR